MITPMKRKRFFQEISLWELSRQVDIQPTRLSLIERGFKQPHPDEMQKIAEALKCSPQELFPE